MNEVWKQSNINPDWQISNLGRVRGMSYGTLLTIVTDPYTDEYIVNSRHMRRYYTIDELYLDAFGDIPDDFRPWLSKESVSGRGRLNTAVKCVETGQSYASISAAARDMGIDPSAINRVVSGERETARGYHFYRIGSDD